MPALLLIRHGQGRDPTTGGYDGLSEIGGKQASRVGEALMHAGVDFSRTYAGPLIRQVRTAQFAMGESGAIRSLPELAEHAGHEVVAHVLANPGAADAETAALLADPERASPARMVASVVRGWALGRIQAPVSEDYATFRARVGRGLQALCKNLSGNDVAIAFTSGGFIGAAVAQALGLDVVGAVELGLQVDNASITELRFSSKEINRFMLKRFNGVGHLPPDLITGI